MAKKPTKRAAYRDTKTGRFVSAKTYKRSRARGSKRYRRAPVRTRPRARAATPTPPPSPRPGKLSEYFASFEYKQSSKRRGRVLDFEVHARAKERVISLVLAAIARGHDDSTPPNELEWAAGIPWDEFTVDYVGPSDEKTESVYVH